MINGNCDGSIKLQKKLVYKSNSMLVSCQFYHISPGVPDIEPIEMDPQTG
jgi:hypothetical protein